MSQITESRVLSARLVACCTVFWWAVLSSHAFADEQDPAGSAASDQATSNVEQQKRFEAVKKNIEQLKKDLDKAKSTRDGLQNELEKSEKYIQELNNKAREIKKQLEEKQKKLSALQNERLELQKKKLNRVAWLDPISIVPTVWGSTGRYVCS